ncbi:MAG: hexameric tyrosine-coordinated heme protein [Ottowia sp.]|nr:hexameric tyrosine-coordinated heme protein [Ottowia sp.]
MKSLLAPALLSSVLLLGISPVAQAADDYMPSLITETPLEGRQLAITIVRKTIGTIQQDGDVKKAVREKYADDPELLMQAAGLVTQEFRVIAEANNYWRDSDAAK